MNKKQLAHAALASCVLLFVTTPAAIAADWRPELLTPAESVREPVTPIRVRLPALPAAVLDHLAMELDEFDITTLVTLENRDIVFTPPTPLSFGTHRLRLIEYAPDNTIIQRGVWNIEVRKSTAFREAGGDINATVNLSQRLADKNLLTPAPDQTQSNGGARLHGVMADGHWHVQGSADLLYNNQSSLMPRQKDHFDAGQYLIKGDAGPATATIGHQVVAPDSLVMQGFNRRGVSAGWVDAEAGNAITVFGLHAQDVIGLQDGLGIGDSKNRIQGVVVSGRPLAQYRDALTLSAAYLTGEGPSQTGTAGSGVAGDTTVSGGKASSVIADSQMLARRLHLRGELAATRYDFDGADNSNAPENSHAYTALTTYTPWQDKIVNNLPVALNFGVENSRIGTFFRSPARPNGISDRKGTRGFVTLNWGGLQLNTYLSGESDNVDDLALLPRTQATVHSATVGYLPHVTVTPSTDAQQPAQLPWYGQPGYNLSYTKSDLEVTQANAIIATGPLRSTRMLTGSTSFTYTTWMWSLSHNIVVDDDLSNRVDDLTSRTTQLNANFRFGEKLNISPTLQLNKIEDRTISTKSSHTLTGGFNLLYAYSQRLSSGVDVSINRQKMDDGSIDTHSRDLIGRVSWLAVASRARRPGMIVALEGQQHRVEDSVNTLNARDSYQIFIRTSLSWTSTF